LPGIVHRREELGVKFVWQSTQFGWNVLLRSIASTASAGNTKRGVGHPAS